MTHKAMTVQALREALAGHSADKVVLVAHDGAWHRPFIHAADGRGVSASDCDGTWHCDDLSADVLVMGIYRDEPS